MSTHALTGSRIRERRLQLGLKQSEIARKCEISPSYLNLIEHNRRPIGGKILNALAAALETDPDALQRGAEAEVLDGLRSAAATHSGRAPELDQLEEMAGRFPGWTGLIVAQSRRIGALEQSVTSLNDRLMHDTYLSESLHEVLSAVTAIQATSDILTDETINPEWQARFSRNLKEDSTRLAEISRDLVRYFDPSSAPPTETASPEDESEVWLMDRDFHVPELETPNDQPVEDIVADALTSLSPAGRMRTLAHLKRYKGDAMRMPLAELTDLVLKSGMDPSALIERFGVDFPAALRRLASLPQSIAKQPTGLFICDGTAALRFRKPIEGFSLPRAGMASTSWPIYRSLSQPMTPMRQTITSPGSLNERFQTYSFCHLSAPKDFESAPEFEATMLVIPMLSGE